MLYPMKLISVNIEMDKHLSRVLPFIEAELPDVLCLQEVFERDLVHFKKLGYSGEFIPESCRDIEGVSYAEGVALLSRHTLLNASSYYYRGTREMVCTFDRGNVFSTQQKGLIHADIYIDDVLFTVATTHFTWTPDGPTPSPEQIVDIEKFIAYTATMHSHVMCGDFNIPRHQNPLYKKLTQQYTDTIPAEYQTSLDSTLHHLGHLPEKKNMFDSFMIDYLFTKAPYTASDVRLQFGISDHAGIIATVVKETTS